MTANEAKLLLEKYNQGLATDAEAALVQYWLIHESTVNHPELDEQYYVEMAQELRSTMILPTQPSRVKLWSPIAIAAAVATIIVSAGIWFLSKPERPNQMEQLAKAADIAPGKNGATLTLSTGRKIYLSDVQDGTIADESGVSITKDDKGQIIYTINGTATSSNAMNTLETSKGEQSQVQLPDGSTVYLNAASSLSYPANFTAQNERKVKLSGEAYFQVAKDKAHPFIVQTIGQQVQVLGTHFNINAYADEAAIKTTLLEGSVSITHLSPPDTRRGAAGGEVIAGKDGIILKPGQQSALTGAENFDIHEVDAEAEVAWKNGKFVFERENITSIMRKISRWYNVDVVYEGAVEKKALWGSISRYSNVSKVLEMLSGTGAVTFEIRDKTIVVKAAIK